jgi:hypothetical protein
MDEDEVEGGAASSRVLCGALVVHVAVQQVLKRCSGVVVAVKHAGVPSCSVSHCCSTRLSLNEVGEATFDHRCTPQPVPALPTLSPSPSTSSSRQRGPASSGLRRCVWDRVGGCEGQDRRQGCHAGLSAAHNALFLSSLSDVDSMPAQPHSPSRRTTTQAGSSRRQQGAS